MPHPLSAEQHIEKKPHTPVKRTHDGKPKKEKDKKELFDTHDNTNTNNDTMSSSELLKLEEAKIDMRKLIHKSHKSSSRSVSRSRSSSKSKTNSSPLSSRHHKKDSKHKSSDSSRHRSHSSKSSSKSRAENRKTSSSHSSSSTVTTADNQSNVNHHGIALNNVATETGTTNSTPNQLKTTVDELQLQPPPPLPPFDIEPPLPPADLPIEVPPPPPPTEIEPISRNEIPAVVIQTTNIASASITNKITSQPMTPKIKKPSNIVGAGNQTSDLLGSIMASMESTPTPRNSSTF